MTKSVPEKMDCIIECVNEPCCRSINYRKTLRNEKNCEMLHNIVYNTSEALLERNSSYDHVYLTNPHKVGIMGHELLVCAGRGIENELIRLIRLVA